jgi:hypothetical protein
MYAPFCSKGVRNYSELSPHREVRKQLSIGFTKYCDRSHILQFNELLLCN